MTTKIHFGLLNYIFVFIVVMFLDTQLSKAQQGEIVVYSNSFESSQDTVGWSGRMEFRNDVPPGGGEQSIYIFDVHAWFALESCEEDGLFQLRCWGKNLMSGGSISISIEGEFWNEGAVITVNENEWKYYESAVTLFCPAGKKIILSMAAGAIVPGSMLVDKIEIINVRPRNTQWIIRNSGTTENLNDVVMLNSSTAIVVGSEGSILKTTDSGETWRNTAPQVDCIPESEDCIMRWKSTSFYDSLNGIVVGKDIIATTNGGEEWQFLNLSVEQEFLSSVFVEPGNIYIGDDSGYVHHSIDSGKTWTSVRITTLPIRSIYPYPGPTIGGSLYLYALTPYSLFINRGFYSPFWEEWGTLDYFQALGSQAFKGDFSENGTMFIVGVQGDFVASPIIIRLRPQDSYWYAVWPDGIGELLGLSMPSANVIYSCGYNGMILKSSNGGDDWVTLSSPTSQTLNSIYFFSNERGFVVGDSGTILFTSEALTNQIKIDASTDKQVYQYGDTVQINVTVTNTSEQTVVLEWGSSCQANYYIDEYSWIDNVACLAVLTSMTLEPMQSFNWSFKYPDHIMQAPVLGVGKHRIVGEVLGYGKSDTLEITVTDLASVNNQLQLPLNFQLQQNYPNPFNPSTIIKYEIPVEGYLTIKIYDILGKEVTTLLNDYQKSGRYVVEWNASNFASGVYFYSIIAGDFKQTKKMVLAK